MIPKRQIYTRCRTELVHLNASKVNDQVTPYNHSKGNHKLWSMLKEYLILLITFNFKFLESKTFDSCYLKTFK